MRYVYLENTNDNHNKFYEMIGNPGASTFKASWGKIGKPPQDEKVYPMTDWYIILDKKLKKGYIDMSHTVPQPQVPFEVNQEHLCKVNLILNMLTLNRKTSHKSDMQHVSGILSALQDSKSRLNGSLTKANMMYLNELWKKLKDSEKTK